MNFQHEWVKILALAALALGSVEAWAECDPCIANPNAEGCPQPPDNPPPVGSMPESVVVDLPAVLTLE